MEPPFWVNLFAKASMQHRHEYPVNSDNYHMDDFISSKSGECQRLRIDNCVMNCLNRAPLE